MSRIRGPAIVCRFIQSTSQLCCRAATEGTWTVGVHAIPRSALPTLLSQLPQRDFTVSLRILEPLLSLILHALHPDVPLFTAEMLIAD